MINEELEFLQHSNYIEGEYSEGALEDAVEAWKYAKSLDKIYSKEMFEIHKILMRRVNSGIAGRIRRVPVHVGNWNAPNAGELRRLLYMFFVDSAPRDTDIAIRNRHVQFEKIHPFVDGNGRVGRIIYNWELLKAGLPLHIIHEGDEQKQYYKWFL